MANELNIFEVSSETPTDQWAYGSAAARAWLTGSMRADDGLDFSGEFDAQFSAKFGADACSESAEITKKRTHLAGAVGVAHPGDPSAADSQLYVTLANRPDLDGLYAVFGRVTVGEDVPGRIQRGDLITRMYVKE